MNRRLPQTLGIVACGIAGVHAPVAAQKSAADAFPAPSSLRVTRDIVYAKYPGRELRLDLYSPAASGQHPTPGIIVVPGGGW